MNRCAVLAAAALALSAAPLPGEQPSPGKRPPRVSDAEAHRPGLAPDRVILTWAGDPARSQAVSWRTSTAVTTPVAQIAPAEASPQFAGKAQSVAAVTTYLKSDLNEAHYHSASFEGLEPATEYAYRVGDGANWSEWFQFRTAAEGREPFTFVYFGDTQNDIKALWSRVIRQAHQDAPKARFFLHAGDLIGRGD